MVTKFRCRESGAQQAWDTGAAQGSADAAVVHLGGGEASLMVDTLSAIDAHKLIVCKLNYG